MMSPEKYLAGGSPGVPMLYDATTDKWRKVTQADWDRLNQRVANLDTALKMAMMALKK